MTIGAEELMKRLKEIGINSIPNNGTPLPKGHGRLIDADAFAKEMDRRVEAATVWCGNATDAETRIRAEQAFLTFTEVVLTAKNMPTIIEADKEEE